MGQEDALMDLYGRIVIDSIYILIVSTFAEADSGIVFPLLDNANENNLAVILYAHQLDVAGNITPAQLGAIIDYAKTLNMDIISATELLNLMDV
jgi:hypothetical protein